MKRMILLALCCLALLVCPKAIAQLPNGLMAELQNMSYGNDPHPICSSSLERQVVYAACKDRNNLQKIVRLGMSATPQSLTFDSKMSIYDMKAVGDYLFFCGKYKISQTDSRGIIGVTKISGASLPPAQVVFLDNPISCLTKIEVHNTADPQYYYVLALATDNSVNTLYPTILLETAFTAADEYLSTSFFMYPSPYQEIGETWHEIVADNGDYICIIGMAKDPVRGNYGVTLRPFYRYTITVDMINQTYGAIMICNDFCRINPPIATNISGLISTLAFAIVDPDSGKEIIYTHPHDLLGNHYHQSIEGRDKAELCDITYDRSQHKLLLSRRGVVNDEMYSAITILDPTPTADYATTQLEPPSIRVNEQGAVNGSSRATFFGGKELYSFEVGSNITSTCQEVTPIEVHMEPIMMYGPLPKCVLGSIHGTKYPMGDPTTETIRLTCP